MQWYNEKELFLRTLSHTMQITRRLEFDAGHRIPCHKSQCRHMHGHRYVLEVTLSGRVINAEGASDEGMVMDFADVKAIAMEHLVAQWDHAFLAYAQDSQIVDFLATLPDHKTVLLPFVPTVENLALEAFRLLDPHYRNTYGNDLTLAHIRLYETPNNWADVNRSDL